MVINKRKKNSRLRGSWTHGWGEKKKHRGAGHRGGKGNAGSGKRGDAKKPRVWSNKDYFGKRGFIKKNVKTFVNVLNIKVLESSIPKWISDKKIEEKSGVYVINLTNLGYNKLLGTGTPTKKMEITVSFASTKAMEKIKNAGGTITVQSAPAE